MPGGTGQSPQTRMTADEVTRQLANEGRNVDNSVRRRARVKPERRGRSAGAKGTEQVEGKVILPRGMVKPKK